MAWLPTRAVRRLLLGLAASLLATAAYLDWPRIAAHWLFPPRAAALPATPQLDLGSYAVSIEALPIPGLSANASGLTYSQETGTLFVAVNRPPALAELPVEGRLLRHIPLPAAVDPEGVTHVEGDLFAISDESDNRLHWVRIRPGTPAVQAVDTTRLALDFSHLHNLGFEGLSWDESRAEMLVVNEKWPRRILAVDGLLEQGTVQASGVRVRNWNASGWLGPLGSDLASLSVHSRTGNLLILSEESAAVSEYSRQGALLGVLPLWKGVGGLRHKIRQPEGISVGPDDAIYLIAEPNLFYRFTKAGRPMPAS
ncbi:MAG: SdiA-regulated domain-containing protein [Comamonas sp.]